MHLIALVLVACSFFPPPVKILTADLKPETLAAFERYVKTTETRIAQEERDPNKFLYVDEVAPAESKQIVTALKQGSVFVKQLATFDFAGHAITAPGGLIHHWLGIVWIPNVTLPQVLRTVQDYDDEKNYYKPEVVRSRLVSHNDDDFKVYLRLREKRVITVTLDTDHEVRYRRLDDAHWSSRSYSTRIQEVDNAGERDESLMPVGHDGGFLWRIESYWRFQAGNGGVYVQCESISLTRDIPAGFGWLVGSFVTSIPRESLETTLKDTRAAVLAHAQDR